MSLSKSSIVNFCCSQKYLITYFLLLVFITVILLFYTEPDLHDEEQNIVQGLGQLHMREQNLDMEFRLLQKDTNAFLFRIYENMANLSQLSPNADIQRVLKNLTSNIFSNYNSKDYLKVPTVYDFLSHLLSDLSSLKPAYKWSKDRTGVSTVLGIPTVKRSSQSYLLATLNDLIHKMNPKEKENALIVVLIAETDEIYVQQIVGDIKHLFLEEMEAGLIDIIAPSASYYPDFNKLTTTLSDPLDRVRWRSKQSLDFAFLMTYSYPRGMFYVQLEDDIIAKNSYLTTMTDLALNKIANNQRWFVLDFCQLGFIGKMFRCSDLPKLIEFFFMFFNDKPVDWLLDGFIQTKMCNLEKDYKHCRQAKDQLWIHIKPSLFQHIGTTSSLKGKVQKLKDKHFGKVALFRPNKNPQAVVFSTIKHYEKFSLQRAYNGETFFWGISPKKDDYISFQFRKPIKITRYKFTTGNAENPSDILNNASVAVALVSNNKLGTVKRRRVINIMNEDNSLVTIGSFNNLGCAEAIVDSKIGLVKEL